MSWTPQDESTFRDRIVRIEKTLPRKRRRGASMSLALPLRTVLILGLFLIGVKTLVLASVSEGAYRAAALELAQDGPVGAALATVFGPDPVSLELARRLSR